MARAPRETLVARLIALGHDPEMARALIMAGCVKVSGEVCTHVGREIAAGSAIVVDQPSPYPSRGALKLEGALNAFSVDATGRVGLDIGAAHGGFTALLLERGVRRIYTVDVAYGMLDFRLRMDPRVVVRERHNVRHLVPAWFLGEDLHDAQPWIITADLSFISLRTVLPVLAGFGAHLIGGWEGVLLIKPQFEDSEGTDRGILRDPVRHERALLRVEEEARASGIDVLATSASVVRGARGNQEVFLHLRFPRRQ